MITIIKESVVGTAFNFTNADAVNFVNIQADKASMLLKTVGLESNPHGIASKLRDEAGYSTAWVGKWHAVGDGPVSFGFEVSNTP